jgi:hypothetical protein
MFYKETKNIYTTEELNTVNNGILGNDFPWYYQKLSTTEKFPFFSHGLIQRYDHLKEEPKSNSDVLPFFTNIFKRFCEQHKIKFNKITRACMNLVVHRADNYENTDPHVDHEFKHKVFMLYLNDAEGDTKIFNEVYKKSYKGNCVKDVDKKYTVLKRIRPEQGKAVCWDGKYYHAASFPKPGTRRIVVVFTFI